MTHLTELTNRLAALEQQLAELREEQFSITAQSRTTISEIDAALAPLDEEVRRGLDDGTARGRQVRQERRALLARKTEAERAPQEWENGDRGSLLRQVQERVNETRQQLDQTRFAARTDEDFDKAESAARFKLHAAQGEARVAREGLAHWDGRLADARNSLGAEADAVHELAELTGEKEQLQGDAFLAGRSADLADVSKRISQAEKALERERVKAEGARAAIPQIEGKIEQQRGLIAEAEGRAKVAEGAVLAAAADRARHQLATLVGGMRGPLLTLEAADPQGGFGLYRALAELGLHIPTVNGGVEVPSWMHSPGYRPDSYLAALDQERARLLGSAAQVDSASAGTGAGVVTARAGELATEDL